ncbi:MAG: flagellar motor protein MotB [Elusimicrobia bacterium]|nr:flagellar motor protein MotB [Elusimicrobiota bacterium]
MKRPRAMAEAPGVDPGLWMVPYADLMSNMMILFLSLFAYSYASRSPEIDQAMSQVQAEMSKGIDDPRAARRLDESKAAVELEKAIRGLTLDELGVKVTARRVRLALPAPILFAEGSDRVTDEGRRALAPLAKVFATLPNTVLVEGHTDDRPIAGGRIRTNWELSAARAFAVIEVLAGSGLPPERFRARGHGEFRPVADNATPQGRRANRRIEISLVREAPEPS